MELESKPSDLDVSTILSLSGQMTSAALKWLLIFALNRFIVLKIYF